MRLFPRRILPALACVILAGCITRPTLAVAEDDSLRLLMRQSEERLRALVANLSLPASTESMMAAAAAAKGAAESLETARNSLVARAAILSTEPGASSVAELAIAGVTLTVCRESLRKVSRRAGEDWAGAGLLARGELTWACLLPLSALSPE